MFEEGNYKSSLFVCVSWEKFLRFAEMLASQAVCVWVSQDRSQGSKILFSFQNLTDELLIRTLNTSNLYCEDEN